MNKTSFVPSIKESELKEGHMKPVRVKGRPILLVRQGGEVYGVSNRCPHAGYSFEGAVNLVRYDFSMLTVVRWLSPFALFRFFTTYIKGFTTTIQGFC